MLCINDILDYRFPAICLRFTPKNHVSIPQRPYSRVQILTKAEEGEDPLQHSCCLQSSVQRHLQGGKINFHVSHKRTVTDKWATAATSQEEEEERLKRVQSLPAQSYLMHSAVIAQSIRPCLRKWW